MRDTANDANAKISATGALALGALGVVYGDIGTSPLYTIKTAVEWAGGAIDPQTALGIFSLIVWTLTIITSVKYVAVVMRADNDGEGGILALMSLLGVKHGRRPFVIGLGMLGAALLFGDGAITPAISVLSALEGLKTPAPAIAPYIPPLSVVVLIALFLLQSQGTERISKLFGPIMTLWFLSIGALGFAGIMRHPDVLWALNPLVGLGFLFTHGWTGFLLLGAVFLCATGAEALYADMGHFGRSPIRLAWYGLVLPMLLLNYAGQTALIVDGPFTSDKNPFFDLCPSALQLPLVALATLATIIASQSIITGAFSMTRQAIQLGLLPRIHISQTSAESYGQIYVGFVNWALMALTLALTLGFRSSEIAGRGVRHRGLADDVSDERAHVRRNARSLALEPRFERSCLRLVRDRRRLLRRRQSRQIPGGRLDPAARRRDPLFLNVLLGSWVCRSARRARTRHHAARSLRRQIPRQAARLRHGGVSDEPHRRRARADAAQSQT